MYRGRVGPIFGRLEIFLDRLEGLSGLSWPALEPSWPSKLMRHYFLEPKGTAASPDGFENFVPDPLKSPHD
eukprot:8477551-Pyramimonas_sp.AAC.1